MRTQNNQQLEKSQAKHELDQTLKSKGWALIEARILDMIERHQTELETDLPWEETIAVRKKVATLRLVLQVPEILRAELSF